MKNENLISHNRYYVYRHILKSENDSVEYYAVCSIGSRWVNFECAELFSDYDQAKNVIMYMNNMSETGYIYCIGQVVVSVNNYWLSVIPTIKPIHANEK